MKSLSIELKRLRAIRDWTQEDLAHEVGVCLSTVQRWESKGGHPIRIIRKELIRLFTESDMDVEYKK